MTFALEVAGVAGPRAGRLDLPHGTVLTPSFMPVGTRGTVKALDVTDLEALRPGMVLANAYHLWVAPGHTAVARAGGLHAWTGWAGNMLTDSGGYQAVSLARVGKAAVTEEGVRFSTPEGPRLLSPEGAVEVQEALQPDVMMVLDQPVPFGSEAGTVVEATERTHRWAARSRKAWGGAGSQLWGIVQGGFDPSLRRHSAEVLSALDFPGYAVGGLSLGEPGDRSAELLSACTAILPPGRPRYLMGVGTEPEMLAAIALGVDLFDCVWPTRLARTGAALVGAGRLNLRSSRLTGDGAPLEPGCGCAACAVHSRAQVSHLLRRGELLGYRLLSIHNLHHTLEVGRRARAAILAGRFREFVEARTAAWSLARTASPRPI